MDHHPVAAFRLGCPSSSLQGVMPLTWVKHRPPGGTLFKLPAPQEGPCWEGLTVHVRQRRPMTRECGWAGGGMSSPASGFPAGRSHTRCWVRTAAAPWGLTFPKPFSKLSWKRPQCPRMVGCEAERLLLRGDGPERTVRTCPLLPSWDELAMEAQSPFVVQEGLLHLWQGCLAPWSFFDLRSKGGEGV